MIKKIKSISNYGVYKNFDWDTSLRDNGRIIEFSKLNILFGRNYSGKTTLSRIVRCLEDRKPHPDYPNGQFTCEFENGNINNTNVETCKESIRVFNRDFVKDNLQILLSDSGEITPFAILGGDNIKTESLITELKKEIGDKEKRTGQELSVENAEKHFKECKEIYEKRNDLLAEKLRNKARLIKEERNFGAVTYRADHLDNEINKVLSSGRKVLDAATINSLQKLSEESKKDPVSFNYAVTQLNLNLDKDILALLETKVSPTIRIDDLAENTELQAWVKTGMSLNKERSSCGFCGNTLTDQLWKKLKDHFSEESERLSTKLNKSRDELFRLKGGINALRLPSKHLFYSNFLGDYEALSQKLEQLQTEAEELIQAISEAIEKKQADIFKTLNLSINSDLSNLKIPEIVKEISSLVEKNNKFTTELNQKQNAAREDLRLNEVTKYAAEIAYSEEKKAISELKTKLEGAETEKNSQNKKLDGLKDRLRALESELKDEKKGAEQVNKYLSNYFGHNSLKLVHSESEGKAVFRIKRGNEDAKNLSEGESSLIAFCYFMARLHDLNTKKEDTIIWIDDPISSLDSNHIFFIFSLIEKELAQPQDTGAGNKYFYKQLFLSTHNIDFLKYLKRLSHPHTKVDGKKKVLLEYFMIERIEDTSTIKLMPKYLKEYATEFNYLFARIKTCAETTVTDDNYDTFYNFGNNLRKFLESYLFYRYPSIEDLDKKMRRFFEDAGHESLIARISNELSHAYGTVERTSMPIDIPEAKKVAEFVLAKIKEKDPEQYDAFLQSVG